jgi:hypothetical protein
VINDVEAILAVPSSVLRPKIYSGPDMAGFGKGHDKHDRMIRDMTG